MLASGGIRVYTEDGKRRDLFFSKSGLYGHFQRPKRCHGAFPKTPEQFW